MWASAARGKANPVTASRHIKESDLDVVSRQVQSSGEAGTPIDLLLTAQWPAGVERWTRAIEAKDEEGQARERNSLKFGSALVSRLAKDLEPRYHLAGTHNIFYERAPYRNHVMQRERYRTVTRFIGLAAVKNPLNQQVSFEEECL